MKAQLGGSSRTARPQHKALCAATPDNKAAPKLGLLSPTNSLFLTAMLWGTNPVCLRFLDLSPNPPPAALLTAVQSCTAAAWLFALQRLLPAFSGSPGSQQAAETAPDPAPQTPWLPAVELGLWTFAANAATVLGFQHSSASRGAFLIRLTVVFTPFVAAASGLNSGPAVWGSSVLALLGGLLIAAGGSGAPAQGPASGFQIGDLILAGAALMWSCQTVRLGRLVSGTPALQLAARQMAVTGVLCLLWAALDASAVHPGDPSYGFQAWQDPPKVLALVWPALGPWGLGSLLQMQGQQSISAARTQIILASDPVWATVFAGLVLGSSEQNLGPLGWGGAACILAASLLSREESS